MAILKHTEAQIDGTRSKPGTCDLHCHKVVVIVPAYNEERFIGSVVLKLRQHPVEVLVVDDGSSDQTAAIAKAAGAEVIQQCPNQGKGAALNAGLCRARQGSPEAVVLIDGDGQHLPEELQHLLAPVLAGESDIAIGSRYLQNSSNTPLIRRLGHRLLNWLTGLSSGVAVSDSQCGYRAFSRRAYEAICFSSRGFSVECEMQFTAHELGLRIVEVPVTVRYLDQPKRPVVKQGLAVLNGVLRLAGQYRPLLFIGLPGLIMLIAGIVWAFVLIERLTLIGQVPLNQVLFCSLLILFGVTTFLNGVTLHSIRGLLIDLFRSNNHHAE